MNEWRYYDSGLFQQKHFLLVGQVWQYWPLNLCVGISWLKNRIPLAWLFYSETNSYHEIAYRARGTWWIGICSMHKFVCQTELKAMLITPTLTLQKCSFSSDVWVLPYNSEEINIWISKKPKDGISYLTGFIVLTVSGNKSKKPEKSVSFTDFKKKAVKKSNSFSKKAIYHYRLIIWQKISQGKGKQSKRKTKFLEVLLNS